MWVIKIGGSLATDPALKHWLAALAQDAARRWVIVPGGGPYAEAVRTTQQNWAFGDREAHGMAIRAMGIYAMQLCAIEPCLRMAGDLVSLASASESVVWLPDTDDIKTLSEDWQTSSDSIALWLAGELRAEGVVLLKSLAAPEGLSLQDLARDGHVDGNVPGLVARGAVPPVFWAAAGALSTDAPLSMAWSRIRQ